MISLNIMAPQNRWILTKLQIANLGLWSAQPHGSPKFLIRTRDGEGLKGSGVTGWRELGRARKKKKTHKIQGLPNQTRKHTEPGREEKGQASPATGEARRCLRQAGRPQGFIEVLGLTSRRRSPAWPAHRTVQPRHPASPPVQEEKNTALTLPLIGGVVTEPPKSGPCLFY